MSEPMRVLLTTEGTYPYIVGGVSTWCDNLVNGLSGVHWQVLPLTAGGLHRQARFELPSNAELFGHVDLWTEAVHAWNPFGRARHDRSALPAELVRGLLGWESDLSLLVEALLWCRANPSRVRPVFRSKAGWNAYLEGLEGVLAERCVGAGEAPDLDVLQATELYQSLYWAARTAATPTPEGANAPHLLHVTAAGWSGLPAVLHRHIHGIPLVLTEHGVYVREAYLAAVRSTATASGRWVASRLARGLARVAYSAADIVAPVTQANAAWEHALGVEPERIRTIYNGVLVPHTVTRPPGTKRVVSVGRIDPLKDVKTMLRTASAVLSVEPDANFAHYGPVPEGQAAYARECYALHQELALGDRFRFMGPTDEPHEVLAMADVAILSSISEGFPMALLEAMAVGRPVVATAVGGVSEAITGCGFTAPPGDHESLAAGLVTLLRDPILTRALGERAHARVARNFGQAACLESYRSLFEELTGRSAGVVALAPEAGAAAAGASSSVDVIDLRFAAPNLDDGDGVGIGAATMPSPASTSKATTAAITREF